jgi:hypothetical protein
MENTEIEERKTLIVEIRDDGTYSLTANFNTDFDVFVMNYEDQESVKLFNNPEHFEATLYNVEIFSDGLSDVCYYWVATDLDTLESLDPDMGLDAWVSDTDDEEVMRKRIAEFHDIPVERVSCYIYTTSGGDYNDDC